MISLSNATAVLVLLGGACLAISPLRVAPAPVVSPASADAKIVAELEKVNRALERFQRQMERESETTRRKLSDELKRIHEQAEDVEKQIRALESTGSGRMKSVERVLVERAKSIERVVDDRARAIERTLAERSRSVEDKVAAQSRLVRAKSTRRRIKAGEFFSVRPGDRFVRHTPPPLRLRSYAGEFRLRDVSSGRWLTKQRGVEATVDSPSVVVWQVDARDPCVLRLTEGNITILAN